MDHAFAVRRFQSVGQLQPNLEDFFLRQGPGCQPLIQRCAGDQLSHQEIDVLLSVEVMHSGDIRMIQARQSDRFLAEAFAGRVVCQGPRRQDLEGDVALQALIVRAVHHAHPARADSFENPIVTQRPPDDGAW